MKCTMELYIHGYIYVAEKLIKVNKMRNVQCKCSLHKYHCVDLQLHVQYNIGGDASEDGICS